MILPPPVERLAAYVAACPGMDVASVQAICDLFQTMQVHRGEVLLWDGAVCDRIVFVANGCVRIYLPMHEQECTRLLAFDGEFATSLESFLSRAPCAEITQAVRDSTLLVLPYARFDHARTSIPGWHAFFEHYLQDAYINNTRRLLSLLTKDATERYRDVMKEQPHIAERVTGRILASYLNMSEETLSRIRSKESS